jgi:hypothetical protein
LAGIVVEVIERAVGVITLHARVRGTEDADHQVLTDHLDDLGETVMGE